MADSLNVPIVFKSGSLSHKEISVPVIGLNRDCFTFVYLRFKSDLRNDFLYVFYSISCAPKGAVNSGNHSTVLGGACS